MEEYRRACRVLGVAEGASRKEIEDRYFLLVKKYKRVRDDETPSPGAPTFAVINEAYRQLCGFAPMEKEHFRDLDWKQKLRYLREHYAAEIAMIGILLLALAMFVTAAYQMREWYRNVQDIRQHDGEFRQYEGEFFRTEPSAGGLVEAETDSRSAGTSGFVGEDIGSGE